MLTPDAEIEEINIFNTDKIRSIDNKIYSRRKQLETEHKEKMNYEKTKLKEIKEQIEKLQEEFEEEITKLEVNFEEEKVNLEGDLVEQRKKIEKQLTQKKNKRIMMDQVFQKKHMKMEQDSVIKLAVMKKKNQKGKFTRFKRPILTRKSLWKDIKSVCFNMRRRLTLDAEELAKIKEVRKREEEDAKLNYKKLEEIKEKKEACVKKKNREIKDITDKITVLNKEKWD